MSLAISLEDTEDATAEPVLLTAPHEGVHRCGSLCVHLSDLEQRLILAVCHGLGTKDIARKEGMPASTVKNHLGAIYLKLHVRDRVQLVILAFRTGMVQ